jgi:hypothetical protein
MEWGVRPTGLLSGVPRTEEPYSLSIVPLTVTTLTSILE